MQPKAFHVFMVTLRAVKVKHIVKKKKKKILIFSNSSDCIKNQGKKYKQVMLFVYLFSD